MTPANPDALADALARSLIEDKFAATLALRRSEAFKAARLLIAGPLAPLLADLQRVTAERDEAREEAYDLKLAAAGGEDVPGSANLVTAEDVRRWRDEETRALATAEARAAQLQAEVEALKAERDEARSHLPEGLRDASLVGAVRSLALSASAENDSKWRWGHALQIGLAFADKAAGEEWEHDGMASVDACYAMAAILNCECGGTAWNEMIKAGAARFAEHVEAARAATAREG